MQYSPVLCLLKAQAQNASVRHANFLDPVETVERKLGMSQWFT